MIPIHVLGPPLAERHHPQRAAGRLSALLDGLLAGASPCLVVAPAGLATVDTEDDAFEEAESLRTVARRSGVALVFGVDIGPPTPHAGRLFACYGGAPILWPAPARRGFPPDESHRLLQLGDARVLPLFASEALDPLAPRRIAQLGELGAIVVLSHGGATTRWSPALARLERLAPVVVAAHTGGAGRAYATAGASVTWVSIPASTSAAAHAA